MSSLLQTFALLIQSAAAHPAPAQIAQDPPLAAIPGEHSTPRDPLMASKYEMRDATRDAPWATEVANEQVGPQLSALAKLIEESVHDRAPIAVAELTAIAGPDIARATLRPVDRALVFESSAGSVWRAPQSRSAEKSSALGLEALSGALAEMSAPFKSGSNVHAKFKVIDVRLSGEQTTGADAAKAALSIETVAYVMIDGQSDEGELQQNATWRCRWRREAGSTKPLLESIAVEAFEECRGAAGSGTLFKDCTQSALGATEAWKKQLTKSLDQWAGELDASFGGAIVGHEGIALGDVDGDGLDDLFVCQSGGLPDRLFRHLPDGTLEDVSHAYGVDFLDQTRSALILDLDNDGDQDIVAALDPWLVFLENRGESKDPKQPRFAIVGRVPGVSVTSLAAADVDRDGDLDVYACGYMLPDRLETTPVPYHDANNGRPNILYRNDGKFAFVDATRELGLDQNNRRFSFAASFEDYDDDGDQDLCVANDFGRKNLYRNDAGIFHDAAAEAGVEDIGAGMGVSWADFDGDGRMDLYLSNMFSSAGERVTSQRNFRPDLDDATRASFQRHARGNSLFKNLGDGTFRDVSIESGTTMGRWAWGAKFVDFDNDGRPDIVVPNGFVTGEDPADL